ncbi:hypothetical protein M440DRAFT_1441201 [Trichoderma longibrachiatum ATCC 18648]|uniref:RING-type domain-containing protein n=1 Tax=Trichoderma longibrachiatum ATCC 18648 TaxID=983965 RepID=A0A2T4BWD4_TRILO|nr:hypothetical protein M440DRAFT_1441201 [Trichoderma longibrachiatum ATCC 18648]
MVRSRCHLQSLVFLGSSWSDVRWVYVITSFAARPAAFGPRLLPSGLSGQLWVGSGFTDDSLDGNGELGCSDLPGWDAAGAKHVLKPSLHGAAQPGDASKLNRRPGRAGELLGLDIPKKDGPRGSLTRRDSSTSSHADIQSIQEGAEIKGKIVLLMRGGCGFLDKVMWAQRRGAIGVIVGDNIKGGPLIQMFAHGDEVDDVTIPSVFTARTTAQLLSSLTQPGSFIEDTLDDNGNPVLKVQQGSKARKGKSQAPKKKTPSKKPKSSSKEKRSINAKRIESDDQPSGWFSRLFSWGTSARGVHSESRPPSSGQLDWVMVEDWNDEQDSTIKPSTAKSKKQPKRPKVEGDDFVIGSHGLISRIFGDDEEGESDDIDPVDDDHEDDIPEKDEDPARHEGLWVTITPTSSASPFFDTLLVLVISPLVTLSIVYALLVLRARIRRRRWRAPKSVVERLPVRTYHTVARSPSLSPRVPSPGSATPTTPLLQHNNSSSPPRSRPRSRTTTGVLESANFLAPTPSDLSLAPQNSRPSRPGHERGAVSAEWKKYMGRQVECVVCLEEYIDGVSRVMRLPCGHEFHADCITPWLTTRRRTCPICKGDVVRSLARGSWAGPRYEPYRDDGDDEDDDDDQAAEGSGYRSSSGDEDIEQGIAEGEHAEARRPNWQNNLFGMFPSGIGGRRRAPSPSPPSDDRRA